jgi:hypothetical protein
VVTGADQFGIRCIEEQASIEWPSDLPQLTASVDDPSRCMPIGERERERPPAEYAVARVRNEYPPGYHGNRSS